MINSETRIPQLLMEPQSPAAMRSAPLPGVADLTWPLLLAHSAYGAADPCIRRQTAVPGCLHLEEEFEISLRLKLARK